MTNDGSFRVMTIECTTLVRESVATQKVFGIPAVQLGEALLAAILVRETMAPAHRVQVLLRNADNDLVLGDAFPGGRTRGLVRVRDEIMGVQIGEGTFVQVMRTLPGRPPHQGIVEHRHPGTPFADVLTDYFKQSEQVETFVGIACSENEAGDIATAAGYIIQLLPELTDPPLDAMRTRLQQLGPLDDIAAGLASDRLLDRLLDGEDYTDLASSPVFYACGCGTEKARSAVAMLGREEIAEMVTAGEGSRVKCGYCQTVHELTRTDLRAVLDRLNASDSPAPEESPDSPPPGNQGT